MNEHMKLDMVVVVGQKRRGKWRRKDLPYITVDNLTFDQYHAVSDIVCTGLEAIAERLHLAGYKMTFRGEQVIWELDEKAGLRATLDTSAGESPD